MQALLLTRISIAMQNIASRRNSLLVGGPYVFVNLFRGSTSADKSACIERFANP
jgi:hypothetical protein